MGSKRKARNNDARYRRQRVDDCATAAQVVAAIAGVIGVWAGLEIVGDNAAGGIALALGSAVVAMTVIAVMAYIHWRTFDAATN